MLQVLTWLRGGTRWVLKSPQHLEQFGPLMSTFPDATFVLTHRDLPKTRDTVSFHSGDLARFVNEHLRATFRSIWFVGGGTVCGECLRLGLADELRYSILPIPTPAVTAPFS